MFQTRFCTFPIQPPTLLTFGFHLFSLLLSHKSRQTLCLFLIYIRSKAKKYRDDLPVGGLAGMLLKQIALCSTKNNQRKKPKPPNQPPQSLSLHFSLCSSLLLFFLTQSLSFAVLRQPSTSCLPFLTLVFSFPPLPSSHLPPPSRHGQRHKSPCRSCSSICLRVCLKN